MGGTTATTRNPKVLFSKPGYYTIKLQATNNYGSDDTVRVNYINVKQNTLNLPVAGFTADNTKPLVTDTVHFTNTSTVAVNSKYLWTFVPNTFTFINSDDTFPEPSIKFYGVGKYTISLKVTNFYGSDTMIKTDYINAVYPTSVKTESKVNNRIAVYPNPITSGDLNIYFTQSALSRIIVELFDLKGSKIASLINSDFKPGQYQLNFNISALNLTPSIYYLKVTDSGECYYLKLMYCR
jgi:PKD repeat protein